MGKNSEIYVAGHKGLVGSANTLQLKKNEYHNLLLKSHAELELTDQRKVFNFFKEQKPDYDFLAAAKVGGNLSNNTYPGQFIYSNLQIQTTVIHACHIYEVKKEYGNIFSYKIIKN